MRPTHSWHFIFKRRRPCNPGQGCRLASPPVLRQARRSGHNDVSHCGWRHAPSAPVTLGSSTVGILRRGIASRNATDAGYATYLQRLVQSKNTNRQKHTAPVTPFPLLPSGRGHEGEEATAPHQKLSRPWQARAGLFTGVCGQRRRRRPPKLTSSPGEEVSLGWRSNLAIWHPPNNKQPRGLRTGHSPATPPCFSGSHLDVSTTRITNRAEPYEHNRTEPNRTELNRTRKNHQRSPCTHVHERPEGDHVSWRIVIRQ